MIAGSDVRSGIDVTGLSLFTSYCLLNNDILVRYGALERWGVEGFIISIILRWRMYVRALHSSWSHVRILFLLGYFNADHGSISLTAYLFHLVDAFGKSWFCSTFLNFLQRYLLASMYLSTNFWHSKYKGGFTVLTVLIWNRSSYSIFRSSLITEMSSERFSPYKPSTISSP